MAAPSNGYVLPPRKLCENSASAKKNKTKGTNASSLVDGSRHVGQLLQGRKCDRVKDASLIIITCNRFLAEFPQGNRINAPTKIFLLGNIMRKGYRLLGSVR